MKPLRSGLVLTLLAGLTSTALTLPHTASATTTTTTATSTEGTVSMEGTVVAALDRAAHPLRTVEPGGDTRDLRALTRMIGRAKVVGVGEATHSSHDFFAMKHRLFRHLVEEKGFRTFALEAGWSTGLRLDDYVLYGKGDPRRIMREEFQGTYLWWNNTDYLALVEWMRTHNRQHPNDPVRFMGDDLGWAGPELYDKVTDYVARAHPDLQARFTELYRGLRPTVPLDAYMEQYTTRPLAERREMATRTGKVLDLLRQRSPRGTAGDWVLQHATVIDQVARFYAYDDETQHAAAMRYRDQAMADNTAWWQRHTGTKVLLSAHNAHIGFETPDAANYPRMQGAFLRDRLGEAYVSVGFTFDRGSFNSTGPDGKVRRFTVAAAGADLNEHTLDGVGLRDYAVDLRTVPRPARDWLDRARPTRSIGTIYPEPSYDIALARTHDILIHLHRVKAARLRDR
ncbi:erythromycin esterase family protein [Streptomyces sp. CA-179760]|uniref:erythromycin esterase family protein n=1 Tax=Streptomyces sp. CA-179760 TaxID=3240054 RepID=UPI003D8BB8C5